MKNLRRKIISIILVLTLCVPTFGGLAGIEVHASNDSNLRDYNIATKLNPLMSDIESIKIANASKGDNSNSISQSLLSANEEGITKNSVSPAITTSLSHPGTTGVDAGTNTRLISKTDIINIKSTINAGFDSGVADNLSMTFYLPYFYYDDGNNLKTTTNISEVPEEQRGANLMGLEASMVDAGDFQTSTGETQNLRGEVVINNPIGRVTATDPSSIEIAVNFYGPVPENAQGQVIVGSEYKKYTDAQGNVNEAGYKETPGDADLSTYTLINTNLIWDVDIEPLSAPVLWDRYNYIGYKVRISNNSTDVAAVINNASIAVNPENFGTSPYGIFDSDLLVWTKDENTGEIVKYDYETEGIKDEDYIGKPQEGGALVWDVTKKDTSAWDYIYYNNDVADLDTYQYTSNKDTTINISGEPIKQGEHREYYIAIPAQPNVALNMIPVAFVPSVIYENGVTWSKPTNKNFKFSELSPGFTQDTYLMNEEKQKVDTLKFDNEEISSIYLDNFKNTTNTPVFNAYAINTLPIEFDLQNIVIKMEKPTPGDEKISLSEWFKDNGTEEGSEVVMGVFEKNGEKEFLPLGSFTEINYDAQEHTYWQLDPIDKLYEYVTDGYVFSNQLVFNFKKRIEIEEAFGGEIQIQGYPSIAFDSTSEVQTHYETWTYSPQSEDPVSDDDYVSANHITEVDTVKFGIDPGVPAIQTDSFQFKNGANEYADNTKISIDKEGVGFRYMLGNTGPLPIHKASFNTGNFIGNGFEFQANEVIISKGLIESGGIENIVFQGKSSGDNFTLAKSVIYDILAGNYATENIGKDANGNLVIKSPTWSGVGKLYNISVDFSYMKEAELNENNYILVEGKTSLLGDVTPTGTYQSDYEDPAYEIIKTDSATLDTNDINIMLAGQSRDAGIFSNKNTTSTIEYQLTVPNKDSDTGYRFELKNDSEAGAGPSDLTFELSSVGAKNNAGLLDEKIIKGFKTDAIVISDNHAKVGAIREIEFFDWDQDIENDTPALVLTAEQIGVTSNTQVTVASDLWKDEIEYLKGFNIVVEDIAGEVLPEDRQTLTVDINGNSNWYDNLDAEMTFTPHSTALISKKASVPARLQVSRPSLEVQTNIAYPPISETNETKAGNLDGNQTTLGIPYDRDFKYRVNVKNSNISKLDDIDLIVTPPIKEESGTYTGFHATEILVSQAIIADIADKGSINITLYDVTDMDGDGVQLDYNEASDTFEKDGVTISLVTDPEDNTKKSYKITDVNLEDLGVDDLGKLLVHGENADYRNADPDEFYVDFYGYLDSYFGTSNIINAEGNNYLDGIREDRYKLTTKDSSDSVVSKMYFDTVLTASYQDKPDVIGTDDRTDKETMPAEQVRIYYRSSASSGTPFYDNSELDTGYKSMGSFMLDFRQYLNVRKPSTGGSYPKDPQGYTFSPEERYNENIQEHEEMTWIYTESMNTALNVETTLDLPEDIFDAYYLKVDPRAIDYIKHITVIDVEGNEIKINQATIQENKENGVETDADGTQFFRINLLNTADGEIFKPLTGVDYDNFYEETDSKYQEHATHLKIDKVIFNLDINEDQQNSSGVNQNPDYSTWYEANVPDTKHMFEVTGRYYDVGEGTATATTQLVAGGDRVYDEEGMAEGEGRSLERYVSGEDLEYNRTDWSWINYYRYANYSSGWYTALAMYDSSHLKSRANIIVKDDGTGVTIGANDNLTTKNYQQALIGERYVFPISVYRTTPDNPTYEVESDSRWRYQDANDWAGRISYTDYNTLTATLPKIRQDGSDSHYGFLSTDLEINAEILEHTDEIIIYQRSVVDDSSPNNPTASNGMIGFTETVIAEPVLTIKKSELGAVYTLDGSGNLKLDFKYAEKGDTENSSNKNEIYFETGDYPDRFVVEMSDLDGQGDYAREYMDKTDLDELDDLGTSSETDIRLGGEVYSTREINPIAEATTNIRQVITYDDGGTGKIVTDAASMQGFRVPFQGGYSITPLDSGVQFDYQSDNLEPTVTAYELNAWNRTDGATVETQSATIDEVTIRNIFSGGSTYTNSEYNIKKLYIPEAFISGSWFGVEEISFVYQGQAIKLTKDGAGEDLLLSDYLVTDGTYRYVDVDKVIKTRTPSTFTPNNTTEIYVNEHVSEFTIKVSALSPASSDPTTVLDGGEYLTSNKADDGDSIYYEGVWVNRSVADFGSGIYDYTSRPTFDMYPNTYGPQSETTNIIGTFSAFDPNADDYAGNLGNTDSNETYQIQNLVGIMSVDLDRGTDLDGNGTIDTFAYDKEKQADGTEKINPVQNGDIMPYDYLDYTLKLKAPSSSALPLQQSTMEFEAPEGMRIVGWEIKSNTTGISRDDIVAYATNGGNGFSTQMVEESSYFYGTDNTTFTEYDYLRIVVGAEADQIPVGTGVEIIVHTQITEEALTGEGDTLEGHQFNATYTVSGDNRHTYGQYQITTDGGEITVAENNLGGFARKDGGIEGVGGYDTVYYRNLVNVDATNTSYEASITSRTSVAHEDELSVEYTFDDLTAQYDNQPTTVIVTGEDYHNKGKMDIVNDSDHNLSEYVVSTYFLSQPSEGRTYQDFTMTEKLKTAGDPAVDYIVKNPVNIGHDVSPTIEYAFTDATIIQRSRPMTEEQFPGVELTWLSEDQVEELPTDGVREDATNYIDEAVAVRIVWHNVPAKGTDGNDVVFVSNLDPIKLKGIGRYHRTTPTGGTTIANDTYNMNITAESNYIHDHLETTENIDGSIGTDFGIEEVAYSGEGEVTTLIRRERPVLTFQTQVFDTEAEAATKYEPATNLANEQPQKIGYRPDDGLWYKFYVENYKVIEETNTEPQGVLLDPVFYDKIPVYIDITDRSGNGNIDASDFDIRWYDEEGNLKETSEVPALAVTKRTETITAKDFGGDTIVTQNDLSHGDTDVYGKLYADWRMDAGAVNSNVVTNEIEYSIYEFTFPEGTRLEVGEAIEIYYQGSINAETAEGLPLAYTDDGEKIYPEYYPKVGEYRQNPPNNTNNWAYPLYNSSGTINNSTTMMDMNYLYHDVGVSGGLNPNVDRWEYLDGSTAYIPGSEYESITSSSPSTTDDVHGDTAILVDYDMYPNYFSQRTVYDPTIVFSTGVTTDSLPTSTAYVGDSKNRDMYSLLLRHRYEDNDLQNWDGQSTTTQNPVLWASSRLHLQAAWLATSSEIIPDSNGETGIEYTDNASRYLGNSRYPTPGNPSYGNTNATTGTAVHKRTYGDDSITTLEYKEEYTARLGTYNYGDWGVDGVEITYILPAGMEPLLDGDGNLQVTGRSLTDGGTNASPIYTDINAANVTATIIQDPENDQGYRAPQIMKDPLLSMNHLNTTGDNYEGKDEYYGAETVPYVVKITIEEPLKKWFNRGEEKGYLMYADLKCKVESYTETGYWYDQVIAKPIETASGNHEYSQIFDMSVYQGDTAEDMMDWNYSSQKGGMDGWIRMLGGAYNPYGFGSNENNLSGSPNMPYIDGFNIQNEEVLTDTEVNGIVTNISDVDQYRLDGVNSSASTGTRAQIREPLVRVWNTLGEPNASGNYGTDLSDYYLTHEINKQILNIHLENNYYWNDQSLNGHGYNYARHTNNYSTNGGNEGTLYYPVVQNILPKNFIPVDAEGEWFTTDNDVNATMELKYDIRNLEDNSDMNIEKEFYDTEVEYIEIENEEGEMEGRFQVNIYPKNSQDQQAKILNGEGRTFSINFITTEGPDATDKDGNIIEDLKFIHQSNITLVSSQLDNYKFTIDDDIAGNPFKVGDPWLGRQWAYNAYHNMGDARKDAVVNSYGGYSGGLIPSDLRNLLGTNFPVNNAIEEDGVERIYEGTEIEVETFTDQNRVSAMLANTDYNQDGEVDTTEEAIMTGIKPFVTLPYIYVESYVNDENSFTGARSINQTTSTEVTNNPNASVYGFTAGNQHLLNPANFDKTGYTPNASDHYSYGDSLWYTTKVVNDDPLSRDRYAGDVDHAKMTVSIHLPSAVRYEDDYELQFSGGGEEYTLTKQEIESEEVAENKGWEVDLLKQEIDPDTKEEILVFQILTPGTIDESLSKEEQYVKYLEGETFDGFFAEGSQLSIKVETKVNPIDSLDDTDKDYWDNEYKAQSYVTFKDTAGSYLGVDNLNSQTVLSEVKIRNIIEYGEDVDLDGSSNGEVFVSDQTARFSVMKPEATARTDTGIQRHLISLVGATTQISMDTSIKSGGNGMVMYLDQFENVTAPVSEFIVDLDIGYKASLLDQDEPVTRFGYYATNVINSIRTGKWEIPDDYSGTVSKATLEENLKVHVYVRVVEEPITTDHEDASVPMGNEWKLLGKYSISENSIIDGSNSDLNLYEDNILQVRYVIKSDVDALNELVPEGFKLAIDASETEAGVQDMDDVDKERVNIEKLPTDVVSNAPYVKLHTINNQLDAKIHINHFVDTWGRYGDEVSGKLSETAHAGYFVDAEAPSMRVDISTAYLSYKSPEFSWNEEDLLIRDSSSMVKYKASVTTLTTEEIAESEEKEDGEAAREQDILSNPQIVLALPKVEGLDRNSYIEKYVDAYSKEYETSPVNDNFTTGERLDEKDLKWTYYVIDREGNKIADHNIKSLDLSLSQKWVAFTTADPGAYRTLLNFDFTGYLEPGQSLVVDTMVWLNPANFGAYSTESLVTTAYVYKEGSFIPVVEEGTGGKTYGYRGDQLDLNGNGVLGSESQLTASLPATSFDANSNITRNKYSYSEYNPEGLKDTRPALVPEGTDYSFKGTISVRSSQPELYEKTMLYDVLPHVDDRSIQNVEDGGDKNDPDAKGKERNSNWSGWVKPDTIKVTKRTVDESTPIIDGEDGEIWLGPFSYSSGTIVPTGIETLPAYNDTKTEEFYKYMYGNTEGYSKDAYFVKLSDLLKIKDTDITKYEELSKNVMAIWVQLDEKEETAFKGNTTFELEYSLEAPLNIPHFQGVTDKSDTDTEVLIETVDYQGWNTYAVHASNAISGDPNSFESPRAGVFPGKPADRGYIGSYVWYDEDFEGDVDEGTYTRREDGRLIFEEETKDLDFDGTLDDPGINGVTVELLTALGYPANKEGEAVAEIEESGETKYILVDEGTGLPKFNEYGGYEYTLLGPVSVETKDDAYGNKGYYVISNLKEGEYKLRYSFPNGEYNVHALTTKEIGHDEIPMDVYRSGDQLPGLGQPGIGIVPSDEKQVDDQMVVQTKDAINVEAIGTDPDTYTRYDEEMTSYNVGVSRDYIFSGVAWNDTVINGERTSGEELLENVKIKIYEVDPEDGTLKEAYATSGELAETSTDENGYFEVPLIPGKHYVAVVDPADLEGEYLPTPFLPNNLASKSGTDNDIYEDEEGKFQSTSFNAEIPKDLSGMYELKDGKYYSDSFIGVGLIQRGNGFIAGNIWNDLNYDGIRGQYYDDGGNFVFEPGYENIDLAIEQHYYDPEQKEWVLADENLQIVKTDANGAYIFQNLLGEYVHEGERYLAGYKVRVDLDTAPENVAITKFQTNEGKFDSGLPRDSESGHIEEYGHEILTIAEITDKEEMTFDATTVNTYIDVNGGFKEYELGSIEGVIFFDKDGNGYRDLDETFQAFVEEVGVEELDFTLTLESYYLDEEGKWHQQLDDLGKPMLKTTTVGKATEGIYRFADLPVTVTMETTSENELGEEITEEKTRILGYKIKIDDNHKVTGQGDIFPTFYMTNQGVDDNSMFKPDPVIEEENGEGTEGSEADTSSGDSSGSGEATDGEDIDKGEYGFEISKNKNKEPYKNNEVDGFIVLADYIPVKDNRALVSMIENRSGIHHLGNFDVVVGKHLQSYNAGFTDYVEPVPSPVPTPGPTNGGVNTGDDWNFILPIVLMGLSAIAIWGIIYGRRRSKN